MSYTLRDVYNIVDRDTMDLMLVIFPTDHILRWFYRPNPALDNEVPAELCLEGRDGKLRDLLIKHGVEKLAWKYQLEVYKN